MTKTFVLDTNVLLHNPEALFAFEENDVVIPFAVIEEIDNQKKRQDEIGRNARAASRILDALRATGRLSEGVELAGGGTLRIELNHQEILDFPKGFDPSKHDNRILAVACNLNREDVSPVILVTKDLNLRIKADVLGVRAEDFTTDKVDYQQLYSGTGELCATSLELDVLYQCGKLDLKGVTEPGTPQPVFHRQEHLKFVTIRACPILPGRTVHAGPCGLDQLGYQGPQQGAEVRTGAPSE